MVIKMKSERSFGIVYIIFLAFLIFSAIILLIGAYLISIYMFFVLLVVFIVAWYIDNKRIIEHSNIDTNDVD